MTAHNQFMQIAQEAIENFSGHIDGIELGNRNALHRLLLRLAFPVYRAFKAHDPEV